MNAHKFVAEKGIDEAKRVLEGAHWENIAYSNGHYYSQSCSENDVNLEELKQMVESLDTIESYGGLGLLEYQVRCLGQELSDSIKKAIADYEHVQAYKNGEVKND